MPGTQSISQGRKFGQVVKGAAAIFLRDGYMGASVDDIAQAARVSKATLYSYFPDKGLMFQEAMRAEVARLRFTLDIDPGAGPDQGIPRITVRIAAWMTDPLHVGLYRAHVAEATRFASLSKNFHGTQSRLLRDAIAPHLSRWAEGGLLAIEDANLAAEQLVALSGMGLREHMLLGKPRAAIDAAAAQAAALFLRANAPEPRQAMRRGIRSR